MIVKNTSVPAPKYTVDILGLTDLEAQVLVAVLNNIGGTPEGPRGVMDRIRKALAAAEVDTSPISSHPERTRLVSVSGTLILSAGPDWLA